MQEGYWVTRTYEAGAVGEKIKFFVPGTRPDGKIRRRQRDEIRKAKQNQYSAVKAMARLIHANFAAGDLVLGLDYSPEGLRKLLAWGKAQGLPVEDADDEISLPAIRKAAEHELECALRRVKRLLEKEGKELRAIYITSDMDGETGDTVRVHHHLIINREARDAFVQCWEKRKKGSLGGVDWSPMSREQVDRTRLAEYMIRQVRHVKDEKKFRSTRNLVRPEPKDRIALTEAEVRVPKGCKLLFRQEYMPGQAQYIRYVIPGKLPKEGQEEERA